VLVDGERVAAPNATVPVGGRTTVRLNVTLDDPGTHTVRVGDRSASVTVSELRTTAPGVGNGLLPGVAAAALALLAAIGLRRRW